MKALILNDYGHGEDYATYVYQGVKTIETRMGRLFSHRGDLVICKGSSKSVGENKGMALCIVNVWHGRMMLPSDEIAACVAYHPDRRSLLLKYWKYFSEMFKFTDYSLSKNYQGIFDIHIPDWIEIIPQPQIIGFQEDILEQQSLF